jgi:hypothetical protein
LKPVLLKPILAALLLTTLGASALSCFSPRQPGCAFSCAADGLCPSGYSCGGDGLCHRDDGQGTCDLSPQVDGGGDAPDADDAATDAGGADALGD